MKAAVKDRLDGQEFLSAFVKLDEEDRRMTMNYMMFIYQYHPQYRASRLVTGRSDNVIHVDFRKK